MRSSLVNNNREYRFLTTRYSRLNVLENESTLGRITPLGRPRWVYNSNAERCFLKSWGEMTLKVKVNDPPYSISVKRYIHVYGATLVILAQNHYNLLCGQTRFPTILSHNGQNDLEGQIHLFSIPNESIPEYMLDANLVIPAQICDKLLCGQGKVYGQPDRRPGGGTDTGNDNTGLKGQGANKALSYGPFMRAIHWSLVVCLHKGSVALTHQYDLQHCH